ncbi:MAG: TetR/AcrR family transcriptional regulator [Nitrospira sp.]|nr:TetR/AcrR family transcriptional regulator [Nitrospira sp.]MDR4467561.1 TetR/AcrR family transcriptional regulator [Nitrospira sp.]
MGTTAEASLSRVERRKARTNKRLLEVARRLFSEKGIYWAKIEDITELADQGKGTFYKYFDSKEAIICALLKEGLDKLTAKTEEAVQLVAVGPKILSAAIEARVDFFLNCPEYLLFFHQVRGLMQLQVGVANDLLAIYNAHLDRLAELIKPAMSVDQLGSAQDVARAMAAYTSGVLTYDVLFEGQEATERRRQYFVNILDQSLQPLLKAGKGSR